MLNQEKYTFNAKFNIIEKFIYDNFSFNENKFFDTFNITLNDAIKKQAGKSLDNSYFLFFSLNSNEILETINLFKLNNVKNKNNFLVIKLLTDDESNYFETIDESEKSSFVRSCLLNSNKELFNLIFIHSNFNFNKLINFGIDIQQMNNILNFISLKHNIDNF